MQRLAIELTDHEGALLRLLGTAERRGWRAVNVNAERRHGRMNVDLTVRGSGSVDLLRRQLERLHDVLGVRPVGVRLEVSA